jgi:hypothetical protein
MRKKKNHLRVRQQKLKLVFLQGKQEIKENTNLKNSKENLSTFVT